METCRACFFDALDDHTCGYKGYTKRESMKPKFCDYCKYEVEKRGKIEPEWVHLHGSVFCMVTVATVDGSHFISVANVNGSHYPKKEG